MEEPIHKVQCSACRFLGRYKFDPPLDTGVGEVSEIDLLICMTRVTSGRVIARYGSGPEIYVESGPSGQDWHYTNMDKILLPELSKARIIVALDEAHARAWGNAFCTGQATFL